MKDQDLAVELIRTKAHQIWKARQREGRGGSPEDDWNAAREHLEKHKWLVFRWKLRRILVSPFMWLKTMNMIKEVQATLLSLISVVVGVVLTFFSQFFLGFQVEKNMRINKAITIKNEQCTDMWEEFANIYQYLYYSGKYSIEKIDVEGLGQHLKELNVAVIRAEPYISRESFLKLIKVRDILNQFYIEWVRNPLSYEAYSAFISDLEEPMNVARDVLRKEISLSELKIFHD